MYVHIICVCLLTCFPAPHFIAPTPDACGFPLILPLYLYIHVHCICNPHVTHAFNPHPRHRCVIYPIHIPDFAQPHEPQFKITTALPTLAILLGGSRVLPRLPNGDISTPKKGLKRNPHVVSSTSRYVNEVDQLLHPIPFPSTASTSNLFPRAGRRFLPDTSRLSVHTAFG